jgi:hypothetical protein
MTAFSPVEFPVSNYNLAIQIWRASAVDATSRKVVWTNEYLNMKLCNPMRVDRCFCRTCRLHLHSRRVSQARNQREVGLFLGLFFDPEKWGDFFLRNNCCLSTDYAALCPRRWNSRNHRCENLRSYKVRKLLLFNLKLDPWGRISWNAETSC